MKWNLGFFKWENTTLLDCTNEILTLWNNNIMDQNRNKATGHDVLFSC